MAAITFESVGGSQNIIAGLDVIARSEGTWNIGDEQGYNVIVGSTKDKPNLFTDYRAHPNKLIHVVQRKPDGSIRWEGDSTAAGRYQILYRYAVAYMKSLKLPDFGKISQDRIALQLFRECGAYELLRAGKFYAAMTAAKSRWASLPGAGYGQHEQAIETLAAFYKAAGGVLVKE